MHENPPPCRPHPRTRPHADSTWAPPTTRSLPSSPGMCRCHGDPLGADSAPRPHLPLLAGPGTRGPSCAGTVSWPTRLSKETAGTTARHPEPMSPRRVCRGEEVTKQAEPGGGSGSGAWATAPGHGRDRPAPDPGPCGGLHPRPTRRLRGRSPAARPPPEAATPSAEGAARSPPRALPRALWTDTRRQALLAAPS